VTLLPVSTAPAETVLQRAVAPSHRRCGATAGAVTVSLFGTEVVLHRGGAGRIRPADVSP
jgi:hypothetical protein